MKGVIDKLIEQGRLRECADFKLDIRKKPGLDTSAMQSELDAYMVLRVDSNAGEVGSVIIREYEFIPPQ